MARAFLGAIVAVLVNLWCNSCMQLPQIIRKTKRAGHVVFETDHSPYNLNIIGVRNPSQTANSFNDTLYVTWKYLGAWYQYSYPITTDPGIYYRNNPMLVAGTAIVVPGQYRSSHSVGLHKGYKALTQTGLIKVYRDDNLDDVLDWYGEEYEGYFGINIHRSNSSQTSTVVDKWSAGCQVFANPGHFNEFMNLCDKARDIWGNSFTYTLLEA